MQRALLQQLEEEALTPGAPPAAQAALAGCPSLGASAGGAWLPLGPLWWRQLWLLLLQLPLQLGAMAVQAPPLEEEEEAARMQLLLPLPLPPLRAPCLRSSLRGADCPAWAAGMAAAVLEAAQRGAALLQQQQLQQSWRQWQAPEELS